MSQLPAATVALVLTTLTLWLQCGGIAIFIGWAARAIAGDVQILTPFRIAALMVRFTTAIVMLHFAEILMWAAWYRWVCFSSWEPSLYFSASSFSTVGYGDITLPPKWRILGPLESLIGVLMCGVSVSLLFAVITRIVGRTSKGSNESVAPHA